MTEEFFPFLSWSDGLRSEGTFAGDVSSGLPILPDEMNGKTTVEMLFVHKDVLKPFLASTSSIEWPVNSGDETLSATVGV